MKSKFQKKIGVVMREYKQGGLHSGKSGKIVKSPKQAIAIALSVARKKTKLPSAMKRTLTRR